MKLRRVFGVNLSSDFPFLARLPAADGEPDLSFRCVSRWSSGAPQGRQLFRSPERLVSGQRALELDAQAERYLLRVGGVGEFEIAAREIRCLPARDDPVMVEIALLGTVMSFWLEQRGVAAMHASAVAVGARGVAFLSGQGGGKSCLAAGFLEQGDGLLSDDVLPLVEREGRAWAQPAYPQMRLGDREAGRLLPPGLELPRVHEAISKRRVAVGDGGWGRYCHRSVPLALALLPERAADSRSQIRLEPVGRAAAAVELARHSFLGRTLRAAGLEVERFRRLAALARHLPFRRLVYPSGLRYLPRVRQAVLEELDHLD